MAGFAQVGCFGAVTNVANAMGQIRGMLMTEGYYMPTTPPLNWMADFVAIPESPKLVDGINRMKGYINIHAQEIAEECEDYDTPPNVKPMPSVERLTFLGLAQDLADTPTLPDSDPYQLWGKLGELDGALLDWLFAMFPEPSRYATRV